MLKRTLSLWLPVLVWCGGIFWLSSIPHLRILQSWWDYPLRKMAHMVEYGILARLVARALMGSTSWSRKTILICSLVLAVLYATTDEYHQSFVAGRHGTPHDLIFDSTGAIVALLFKP